MGNGIVVKGTEEAMLAELKEVFGKMKGEEGQRFRENIEKVRGVMEKSWESGGTREAMMRLKEWFTPKE